MKRKELLIIDAQNDFCDPRGALYVKGAEKDCLRLADLLKSNRLPVSGITLTLDSHHLLDIAHPLYWTDSNGDHPAPFTVISAEDVETGLWRTCRDSDSAHGLSYVRDLEKRGRYSLCIWPPHCLIGSWGTSLHSDVLEAVLHWESRNMSSARKILKGDNPLTEHYGAFEAEVPLSGDLSTRLKKELIADLDKADEIFVAGEALDFCVANTVRQLADSLPSGECGKITILADCVSSVDPSSGAGDSFLSEMADRGVKIADSGDYK